jgi:hypothetical protein
MFHLQSVDSQTNPRPRGTNNGQPHANEYRMVSNNNSYIEAYTASSQALTNAISHMAKSVDTAEFSDAFWGVQQASERCKQIRATREVTFDAPVILT